MSRSWCRHPQAPNADRKTYRVLKHQFGLDDAGLEDLKEEIIYGQRLAVEEERVLTGRLAMLWPMGDEFTPRGPSNGPANAAGVQRVRERGQTRWQDFA